PPGGRALRPQRQPAAVGGGRAAVASRRREAAPGVRAHGLASGGDAQRRVHGARTPALSRPDGPAPARAAMPARRIRRRYRLSGQPHAVDSPDRPAGPTIRGHPMRRLLLAAALATALPAAAQTPAVEPLATVVDGKVRAWRRDIHQHPELGNREVRTAALVAEHLRALGLEDVRTGIATTGVTAVLRGGKPGPRIALRADMDALPVTERSGLPFASKATAEFRGQTVGVMHACGHDAHTGILMGVAEALASMREELPGEVLFIFQPAEEGPPDGEEGGAEEMLAQGIFERFRPEAVFGLHVFSTLNAGQVGFRSGPLMAASDRFNIVVKGRQTHGSRPWGGIDPIVAAADIVGTAQ